MKWGVAASMLLGTREDFIYQFIHQQEIEADTAGEAIVIAFHELEKQVKRPVFGLWDLSVVQKKESDQEV